MNKFILIVFLGLFITCSTQTVQYSGKSYKIKKEAIRLNDKAMTMAINHPDKLDQTIVLLGEAINIDSNYLQAYENKLNFEVDKERFQYGLNTSKSLIKRMPDHPAPYLALGLAYEKLNDLNLAKLNYRKSLEAAEKRIKEQKLSRDSAKFELAIVNYLLGDTIIAQRDFEDFKLKFDKEGVYEDQKLNDIIRSMRAMEAKQ